MKSASAILKKGTVYLRAFAQTTTTGLWIGHGRVYATPIGEPAALTDAIRAVIDASIHGVPHPRQDEWKSVQKQMLEAVGARSWSALAKGAKAVGLQCTDGIVTMTPTRHYEKQGGTSLTDQAITMPLDAQDLGHRLVEAFERCS